MVFINTVEISRMFGYVITGDDALPDDDIESGDEFKDGDEADDEENEVLDTAVA
jgi:hypothetical protein